MQKILLFLLLLTAPLLAQPQYQTIEDILKLSDISTPQFSPNGKWVLFTRHQTLPEPGTTYTSYYLYNATTSALKVLAIPSMNAIAKVQWLPHQSELLVLMNSEGAKKLWQINPATLTIKTLMRLPASTILVKPLPDESGILYTSLYECQNGEIGKRQYRAQPCNALYRYQFASQRLEKLVDGKFFIQNWDTSSTGEIALEIIPPASLNRQLTDIALWDFKTRKLEWILTAPGLEMGPNWSPNGRYLAFLTSGSQDAWSSQFHLKVWDRTAKNLLTLTSPEQGNISGLIWKKDSSGVYFSKAESVGKDIWFSTLTGSQQLISTSNTMIDYFDINPLNQNQITYTQENMNQPEELFLSGKTITRFNRLNSQRAWGESRVITWTAVDGTKLDGILTLPPGYQSGKPIATVVVLHGGPADNFTRRFSGSRYAFPVQVLASQGYAVFRPNPRGSGNYGQKFSDAILKDWGGVDLQDILSGVRYLISSGISDSQRIAVGGWSYGGYLAALASSQSTLFKTSIVGAGIINLNSYIGQVDVDEFVETYLGSPEQNAQLYLARSPIYYAHQVKAPTLLIYGSEDDRVPASQGQEFFRALKRQGIETEFWVIPGMGHRLSYASQYRQVTGKILQWLSRYL